jgi:hypothetical protein
MTTVHERSGELDQVIKDVVKHQYGFDPDTALGKKVAACVAEVYEQTPVGFVCDLEFQPIRHEASCACIQPNRDCDCDPDVTITVSGMQPQLIH